MQRLNYLKSCLKLALLAGFALQLQAVEPLRYVATGARIGVYRQGTNETRTAFWHRTPHQLGGPVDEIQIGFMNWFLNYNDETAITNEVTIEYAWLERASDGQVVPVTFNGSRQLVMPADDTEPYWLADAIDSSVWTGGTPQRDEVFWLNIKGSIPASGFVSQGNPTGYSGSKFILYDPANDPGTYDTTGSVPSITDQYARTRGLPTMFLGRYTEPGYLSVIGIGDSILDGSGDASSSYSTISGFGFFCRAAVDESGANTFATFNLTRHGAASTAPTRAANPRQRHFLKYANVAVEEYGTNDLGSSGTGTVSTIQGRLDELWALCRAEGIQKIIRTQLMPRTTSVTYNWISLEDQTPNTGWGDVDAGDSGKRDELNAGFQTSLANGDIDLVLENLAVVADPTDDHYWLSNGTNDYMTSDGTHLRGTSYAMVAVVLRDALLATTVDENAPRYSTWADAIDWGGEDSSEEADPNKDGISNAMAYALDLSPLETVPASDRPYAAYDSETADGPWLNFIFRENVNAEDVIFDYLSTLDLTGGWDSLVVDDVNVIEETLDPDPDGDGTAILKKVRVKIAGSDAQQFLKLQLTL
ncbi:SGNH/GDSL hydrolase family protein [Coraliomargarita parva]|uniref:SGNH/GDSL hydrolase family protein n=1 Tax=Coraliomargarita parva TaxID=3014050 RepID=UPI0022B5DA8E|nr:SGNH/GDSL hydrolase family protein [Coraliomargarita parva]